MLQEVAPDVVHVRFEESPIVIIDGVAVKLVIIGAGLQVGGFIAPLLQTWLVHPPLAQA
jgi:hypothetical protein